MSLSIEKPGLTLALGLVVTALSGAFYKKISQPLIPLSPPKGSSAQRIQKNNSEVTSRHENIKALSTTLRLKQLKEFQTRPLIPSARDLFQFHAPYEATFENYEPQYLASSPSLPTSARPSSDVVQLSLRYVGYSESAQGKTEAILRDEKQLYVVHEGDRIKRHFVVTQITSSMVEIQDEQTQSRQQFRFVP